MQIRNRNGKLQLIRTVYDPSIKRGKSVLVGTIPSYVRAVSNDLNEKLTALERTQLQTFLDKTASELDAFRQEYAARELPATLRLVTKWYLESDKASIDLNQLAEDSRSEFTALLAAMVKAGVGRTRNRKSKRALLPIHS
jgi:hypothetical protein